MSSATNNISVLLDSASAGQPGGNFNVTLSKPIRLDKGEWSCAVTQWGSWNTSYNISASIGNNIIQYETPDAVVKQCILPDGIYTVDTIINTFNDFIYSEESGYLPTPAPTPLPAYFPYCFLSVVEERITTQWNVAVPPLLTNPFKVYMNVGTINELLGFSPQLIATTTAGDIQANITNGVTTYNVVVNFLDSGTTFLNGVPSQVIFSYSPYIVPAGSLLKLTPTYPVFLGCSAITLQNIQIQIRDNFGRIVDFNNGPNNKNNPVSLQLLFIQRVSERDADMT